MDSLYNLKTLSEIEIVESMLRASPPNTEDTPNETDNSPVDTPERSSVNLIHRISRRIYGFFGTK